jgi:hypothetical protein
VAHVLGPQSSRKQYFFDIAIPALLKQNFKSAKQFEGAAESCRYRSEAGLKCAIGHLISDEHYSPNLEGWAADNPVILEALAKSHPQIPPSVLEAENEFLTDLQSVHDCSEVYEWRDKAHSFAKEYNLSTEVLK